MKRFLVLAVLGLLAQVGLAQLVTIPARVDAGDYSSPSGKYKVWIAAEAIDGSGIGLYRFYQDGKLIWTKTLPITLYDVAMDDQGRIAGYTSYSYEPNRQFHVVLINRDGTFRLHEIHKLEPTPDADDSAYRPRGDEVFFDSAHGRVVFHVQALRKGEKSEQWWVFDVATGNRLQTRTKPYPGHAEPRLNYSNQPKEDPLTIHPPVVNLKLDRRWAIPLQGGQPTVFQNLKSFRFLGDNRLVGLWQFAKGGQPVSAPHMIVADLTSKSIFDKTFEGQQVALPSMCQVKGPHFLVSFARQYPPMDTDVYKFDADTGIAQLLMTAKNVDARRMAAFDDGSFVLQGIDKVQLYDPSGHFVREMKRLPTAVKKKPSQSGMDLSYMHTETFDVEVNSKQDLGLVGVDGIQWFDKSGKFLGENQVGALGLNGTVQEYASGQIWSANYINLLHIDTAGHRVTEVHPTFSDDRELTHPTDVEEDAKGQLWVSNDEGIFAMQPLGRLGRGLGAGQVTDSPTEVSQLLLGDDDSVYAVDRLTANIFHYDRQGKLLVVERPLASNFTKYPPDFALASISRHGDVYLNLGNYGSDGFIHFTPDGARAGKIDVQMNTASDADELFGKPLWTFKPPHELWQLAFSKGELVLFYGKTIEWYQVDDPRVRS